MTTPTTKRRTLCGYCRISFNPNQELAKIERQQHDINALALLFDADVCWHVDDDLSAFSGVHRPNFEKMLEHLADPAHESSGLLAYDLDRLCRRIDDLSRILNIYEKNAGLAFRTSAHSIDLSTTDGRLFAIFMIGMAQKASEDTRRRVTRWHLDRVQAGKQAGPQAFGWLEDKVQLHPVEGPALRDAGYDVLSGDRTCEQVAKDWNRDALLPRPKRRKDKETGELSGPVSKKWTSRTVSQALANPRVGGFMIYQKKLYLEDGVPVKGPNVPAMDPDEWLKLREKLRSPERGFGRNTRREGSRRYMTSAVGRCTCRSRLTGHSDNRHPDTFVYLCPGGAGRGCGRTRIDGASLDAYVNAWVEGRLTGVAPAQVPVDVGPWEREDELRDVLTRHERAYQVYLGNVASPLKRSTQVRELTDLEDKLEALQDELAQWRAVRAQEEALAEATDLKRWREAYAAQDWEACRKTLDALIQAVIVKPAPRKGRRRKDEIVFDRNRVEIVAREHS